ncbi:MAG: hypothetical protein COA42_00175 [Alteromonadaceae bacterium]|nr:MAG: hypothetical protein COA42_00175 [Alteromonadaceae bacterium]
MNLEELAFKLNTFNSTTGVTYAATLLDDNSALEVVCSVNPDASIFVVVSDQQILSVTPLFATTDVQAPLRDELNKTLLTLSPVIPLSSIGLQEDNYVLFGAMPVTTVFENIAHELEVQADNTTDVLVALESYFEQTELTEEV